MRGEAAPQLYALGIRGRGAGGHPDLRGRRRNQQNREKRRGTGLEGDIDSKTK